MNSADRFERDLPDGLLDLAAERRPDYLDDAFFGQVADIRQRPAWVFPERWLPMETVTTRVPTIRLPWRAVGILAMIGLLIATAAALSVGSTRPRVPPPFGQAAKGLIAYAANGDIHTVDPATGVSTALTSGPDFELDPVWSRDGTRIAFLQTPAEGGPRLLFTVGPDGFGLTRLTPEALIDLGAVSFAPDGRTVLAVASIDGRATALLIPTDGSGAIRQLDAPLPTDIERVEAPSFRPPDGAEILIVGTDGTGQRGLFAVDVASGAVRTILEPEPSADVSRASWSPDGSLIAYARFDPNSDVTSTRTHVIGADGTGDFQLADSLTDRPDGWSNDGTRFVIQRHLGTNGSLPRSFVVPVDRSGPEVRLECPLGSLRKDCDASWAWAPDDSVLLGTMFESGNPVRHFLADPATGKATIAPWPATYGQDWQRVAP